MIAIVDYQMGNLRSVQKAFEKVGHHAVITSDPNDVLNADKVVLPGVGAFRDAIAEITRRGLVEPLRQVVHEGKPFLGICLGLQLLFDRSYEGGCYDGLGILRGEVVEFSLPPEYKVPHMGWNQAQLRRESPLWKGIGPEAFVYFVHSYYVVPDDPGVIATETDYYRPFCSAVWQGNLFATQFHPEKSQSTGLRLLQNFAEI
jgi:glutamine amidotransferase